MSETASGSIDAPAKKKRGGCFVALVTCAVLAALLVVGTCASLVGFGIWVTRPGEVDATRSIVSGDEAGYVAIHLEADDEALLALIQQLFTTFQAASREQMRKGGEPSPVMDTYLGFANAQQTRSIAEALPIWVEVASYRAGPEEIDAGGGGLVASFTLSQNYRVYKLLFSAASFGLRGTEGAVRKVGEAKLIDFSRRHGGDDVAVANLANTFFISNDPLLLEAALERFQNPDASRVPQAAASALAAAGDSFDAWGFTDAPSALLADLGRERRPAAEADARGGPFSGSSGLDEGEASGSAEALCADLPPLELGVATMEVLSSDSVEFSVSGDSPRSAADLDAASAYGACLEALLTRLELTAEVGAAERSATGGFRMTIGASGVDAALASLLERARGSETSHDATLDAPAGAGVAEPTSP